MSKVQFEKVEYKGWANCTRVTNGLVELVLTGDVGPRIIRFGFPGQDNEFWEDTPALGLTGGDEWRIYGGHRLWHAPEEQPRTYCPDNQPVDVRQEGDRLVVTQDVEATTGIQKQMVIEMSETQPEVSILHRLTNRNLWAVELAPWAISPMASGGVGIVPLPPFGIHAENLQPSGGLALWAYTDFLDPRWRLGSRYIMLSQDPAATTPQKVGVRCSAGWMAYARGGHLFVNRYQVIPGANYPDFGCTVEVYTDANMLEIETLGPTSTAAPGGTWEHHETWQLFDGVPAPHNDGDVVQHVLPHIG